MPLDASVSTRVDTDSRSDQIVDRCDCNSPRSGWIVAVTHPQAETWADSNLQRRGYRVFLPRYATKRRDPVLRTLTRVVIAPLWPGYLFVHHDSRDSWRPIYETPGVRSVLKTRDQIQWANAGAVEALEAAQALAAPRDAPDAPWRVGDLAAPASWHFAGLKGVIVEIRGKRAILAIMLGDKGS